jgi:MSHA biogenesis protein MshK
MDDIVNLRLIAAAALMAAAQAAAQALPDPTRPPASILAPASAASADAAPASAGPQLQSVLIARHPGGRHVAVIDGQTVQLGDKYKGALLTRMTATEVVLVNGKSRQVLKLYPTATPTK